MPDKTGRQTPQERRFVELFAATGDRQYAGAKAGYAHPTVAASKVLARPSNADMVRKLQQERLFSDVLPLAVDVHLRVLRNPATPAGAMVQAIKLAYDRTLGASEAGQTKDLADATAAELQELHAALVRKLSELATPVLELEAEPAKPGVFA